MGSRARCAGCSKPGKPVCADCQSLAEMTVVVSRSRVPGIFSLLLAPILFGLAAWLVAFILRLSEWPDWLTMIPYRHILLTAAVIVLTLSAVRSLLRRGIEDLRTPWRFRLAPHGGLRVDIVLGRSSDSPPEKVLDENGTVVLWDPNRRYTVTEARFPGARGFHRALNVRIALATAEAVR